MTLEVVVAIDYSIDGFYLRVHSLSLVVIIYVSLI